MLTESSIHINLSHLLNNYMRLSYKVLYSGTSCHKQEFFAGFNISVPDKAPILKDGGRGHGFEHINSMLWSSLVVQQLGLPRSDPWSGN